MLKRHLIITSDGSSSIHIPEWDESYHSKHGAIQEAYHVFIKNGLAYFKEKNIAILEIGFGTGLNCFITFLEAQKNNFVIDYTGIEAFPIKDSERKLLNYVNELNATKHQRIFDTIHTTAWEKKTQLTENFSLFKQLQKFKDISAKEQFNLIYFDAFAPRVQPELWTEFIFQKMYNALLPNGILVTYSAKGSVRRAMQEVGFTVEKLSGPPGKREMLRAFKL